MNNTKNPSVSFSNHHGFRHDFAIRPAPWSRWTRIIQEPWVYRKTMEKPWKKPWENHGNSREKTLGKPMNIRKKHVDLW